MKQRLHEKMIHWLPALKTLPKIKILMDDGSYKKAVAEKEIKKLKINTIVQFERFAFCNKTGKEEFSFTHHY